MDPKLNSLLKWSIQNQANPNQGTTTTTNNNNDTPTTENTPTTAAASRGLNPEMLSALFGGPSEADLMKAAMATLHDPAIDTENKLIAFDNFEQLIESLDNANNMEPLGLWSPLLELLGSDESGMRRMAAWCVGTAVQNNERAQDKVVLFNVIPKLVAMATSDPAPAARKKAVYAISSSVRNYQPATDELVKNLPERYPQDKIDAGDMEAIDAILDKLRAHPCEASA